MIIENATTVLKLEAQSILNLAGSLDDDFCALVRDICSSTGRVIISGIGKSGLIGRKIAATLSSTGTNAMFLHPVEAVHGDLGMVGKDDVFIAISNSGETSELNRLLPEIKAIGCRLAGFTGNLESTMAGFCDLLINTSVEREACPFNMAPTCSTTAQLAMGDALAVVLIHEKKFKKSDFMRSHPGGALGQRLSCRVHEIMFEAGHAPTVNIDSPMSDAVREMDAQRLGAVVVIDNDHMVKGIITDGDIRHCMAQGVLDPAGTKTCDIMTRDPHSLDKNAFLYDALNLMETHQITVLPVIDKTGKLEGILHLHDILGKGSFKYNGHGHENHRP